MTQSSIADSYDSIEGIIQNFEFPDSSVLNKTIFKKMFLDNGQLDTTDKACLKEEVEKIRWLCTLKPSTISISTYSDNVREYNEIAVLHIELNSTAKVNRIAAFIQRSIPYPLILIFNFQNQILISLADKRINQADRSKWVVEGTVNSGWMNYEALTIPQSDFIRSLKLSGLPAVSFYSVYKALEDRCIALSCAEYSGQFTVNSLNTDRLKLLSTLEELDKQKAQLTKKLKKEKQLGKQVELNTQIKRIGDNIQLIKEQI